MKNFIALSVLVCIVMVSFLGCNATRGAGKDIENAGKHIENIGK